VVDVLTDGTITVSPCGVAISGNAGKAAPSPR
jgi:hypothetical protein